MPAATKSFLLLFFKKEALAFSSDPPLRKLALVAAMLGPFGLLHAFVLAEIAIAVTDLLFIAETWRRRDFAPWRTPWFLLALAWWLWLLICSLPLPALGLHAAGWFTAFGFAAVNIRFLVFALALESWVLTTPASRLLAFGLLGATWLWIGLESWQQYLTGHNIFGNPRWGDGALTGPFWKPRAGVLFGHLTFVVLPAAAMWLLNQNRLAWRVLGYALVALGAVTAVLIGQRMGTIFVLLGGVVAALLLKRLRRPVLLAFLAAAAVLLASPVISPPTHAKLVGETGRNMSHFSQSPYGELFTRAAVMGMSSPWHGYGYNAFRAYCPESRFDGGIAALGLPPTQLALGACNLHPHNFYLQAFEESGFPGLALFTLLNVVWLIILFGGRDPVRIGLFIGVLTYAWPLASTDEFPTLYEPGWLFFMLGLGLALKEGLKGSKQELLF
jgi:O-antigen ligase